MNLTLSDIGSTEAALAVRVKRWTFGLPGLALSILFLSPFFAEQMLLRDTMPLVLGIVLLAGWAWVIRRMFKRFSRHNPASSSASGIADRMSFHMVQHLGAKTEVTAATILEAATESDRGLFVLHLIGIERADVLKAWKSHPEAMSVDTCLTLMTSAATELKAESLDSTATIYAFFKNVPALQDLLNTQDISIDDLKAILKAEAFHWYWHERHSHNFSPEALVRTMGAVGKSWVTGYNTELESLTVNLSEHAMSYARDTLIHTKELELILGWFKGRAQKNVLLIGKPGSGRRTLTRNLASLIRKAEMERGIGFTDVLKLSTPDLLSGCARGDSELLTALKKAADSGSFVLVIEDLPLLLEGSDARLKDVLYHLLQAGNIRTIGIIDTADYHARVKSDPALDTLFSKIPLSDSTDDETMAVLLEEYFRTTRRNPVRVTYKALKSLIDLSKRFLSREAMPGKAVSALREAISKANSTGQKVISDADVREIISVEARVDVRQLGENERMKLLELESRIGSRIIGHRDAISGIVSALKRARLDIQNRKRPIGTFLFLGTTGVGKTETAKALAEEYFGSAESFIRIDMNEYANEDSLPSLIGGMTQKGFAEGFLTKRIQDRPFSLVLLDEVEKAHLSVLHVFLQILDEGMMNDGNGVATDFKNAIIIATSNAGSHWIAATPPPADPAKRPAYKEALIKQVLSERAFSPEFLNRFDETVVFYPPTKDEIRRIAILMLDQIIRDIADKRGIKVTVESGVIDILAERGFHPEYGAREMRRVITRSVETYLADYLLSHTVKRGDEIVIHADDVRRTF